MKDKAPAQSQSICGFSATLSPAKGRVACAPAIAAAVAGILYGASGGAAYAQTATAGAAKSSDNALEEIVVTASAHGVRKLDASYNIVSASLDEIQNANPASAAEIFKLSPGIWPEASGGQTGVNVDVAGFPNGGGDSPYFSTMIQGSPLYGSPSLSFLDSSSLLRFDDTVERVEIVQGGTGAIFGPGQPGATANFILRTGSDNPAGSVSYTYGNEGLGRVDAYYGAKLTEGWYGSLGGFYRESAGVRDPQYAADLGYQMTGTLKHDLSNGSIMFWARTLNDKNQWVADFPYVVNNGSADPYPGFDQRNSTYNSYELQNFQIPNPATGGFENVNISNGRGSLLNYVGSSLDLKLSGGWSITNSFLFDGGDMDTNALVNNGNPKTLTAFIAGLSLPAPLTPADVVATYTNGTAPALTQSVVTQQVWRVQKRLWNATDEFRLAKDFGNGNTLTAGVYLARYTDNDNWSLGSNVLITNKPNASPIILQATSGGNIYNITSSQGIVSANGGYQILQQGTATNAAFYVSDSWKINQWLLDAAARVEHLSLSQQTTNLAPIQMGSQFDLWDNAVEMPDGTYTKEGVSTTLPAFSLGANYEFSDHMSAYARVNNGVFFPNFDSVRCQRYNTSFNCPNLLPLNRVENLEVGFKLQNRYAYIDASIYNKDFKGLSYQPQDINHVPLGPVTTYGSTSIGLRFIGSVNPLAGGDSSAAREFKITLNANYENAHYKDYNGCYVYSDINGNLVCGVINGVQLARLPKFQYRITPSDTQDFGWGTVTEFLTYEHIGQHYQDSTGLNPLGSYYDLNAGVVAKVGERWQFRLLGSNITNQIGLTEGNARIGGNAVQNGVGFGRSILGREFSLQAKYAF
ncbi:MAG TPA: TonB-dependent receptor plug domain-containing protein [Steroidobacteraceae bacterium]|nr:TonB-dependent receptor plug domain-containing protein [Steroidobacteraceae bacterium]